MDLRPSDEQRQLAEAFGALFADLSTFDHVQAAEPLGHSEQLWTKVLELGGVAMGVPETHGGGNATLLDLALVAEQIGRSVAPVPLIEAQAAARLLARLGADAPLAAVVAGDRLITLAVVPAAGGSADRARSQAPGARATLVPAGAVADDVIVLDGDRLLLVPLEGNRTVVANIGCLPLADVDIPADSPVLASGPAAIAAFAAAVDEWRVLTAAALSGVASRALELGVEYVKVRKAFGKVIGEFQGIAHRLADHAAECDGAQLLARKAAWAASIGDPRAAELAAMALGFAADTARDTAHHALHFHGGYGFMLEYPVQLYWRRARAWAAVLEDPAASYRLVSDRHRADRAAS